MNIIHVLADGTEVKDISDYVIGEENKDFYSVVEKIIRESN